MAMPLATEARACFEREAQMSLAEQQAIEAADTEPFETFRQHYVSAQRLVVSGQGSLRPTLVTRIAPLRQVE